MMPDTTNPELQQLISGLMAAQRGQYFPRTSERNWPVAEDKIKSLELKVAKLEFLIAKLMEGSIDPETIEATREGWYLVQIVGET